MHARHGFTAVELAIAIGIMVLLSGMLTPAVLPALRQGRVNQAVTAITEVAAEARRLALTAPVQPHGACYGVVMVDDGDQAWVALIKGHPGDGAASDAARVVLEGGEPVRRVALPQGVALMAAGEPLGSAGGVLAWYYHTGTGATTRFAGGAFDQGLVEVGTAAHTRADLWGLDNPAVNAQLPADWRYRVVPSVVAPSADDGDHGLCVQTPDGRVRVAIAIHGTGLTDVTEW